MIDGVVNMRDLGGFAANGGRVVRRGLVYRSGHLGAMALPEDAQQPAAPTRDTSAPGIDLQAFASTGIRTVFDLRTVAEATHSPDHVPSGVEVVHLDVLADADQSIAAHLAEIFADPTTAERVLSDGLIDRHYQQTYRNLVLLDSAREAYHRLFTRIADADAPVLFHCTAGKDRTGWAAASLLCLLGVDEELIVADHLRSNEPAREAFSPYLRQFAELGGDPALLEPAFLVAPSYLRAAFDAVSSTYGSIECYFDQGLDVGPDARRALRERLLTEG